MACRLSPWWLVPPALILIVQQGLQVAAGKCNIVDRGHFDERPASYHWSRRQRYSRFLGFSRIRAWWRPGRWAGLTSAGAWARARIWIPLDYSSDYFVRTNQQSFRVPNALPEQHKGGRPPAHLRRTQFKRLTCAPAGQGSLRARLPCAKPIEYAKHGAP